MISQSETGSNSPIIFGTILWQDIKLSCTLHQPQQTLGKKKGWETTILLLS
jgi:hypothetical protein